MGLSGNVTMLNKSINPPSLNSRFLDEGIFPRKIELIHLFFPLALLLGVAVEFFLGHRISSADDFFTIFLANTIFLNSGHAFFSFFFLFYLPEGRAFFKYNRYFEAKLLLIVTITIGTFFTMFFFQFQSQLMTVPALSTGFILLTGMWGVWHTLFQVRGIGLMYDQVDGNRRSQAPKHFSVFLRHWEKWLFLLIFLTRSSYFFDHLKKTYNLPIWIPLLHPFQFYVALLGVCFVLLLLLDQFFRSKVQWNKVLYQMRLFHLVLSPFSSVAMFSMKASHGIESLFFAQSVSKKTKVDRDSNLFIFLFWGGLILFTLWGMPKYLMDAHQTTIVSQGRSSTLASIQNPIALTYLVALFSTTALHYYLESRLFKMRNKSVRETTGIWVSSV